MIQFLQAGGPFMILLVMASIVSLTFIIERALALRRVRVAPDPLVEAVENCTTREGLSDLHTLCRQQPSVLARLTLAALEHLDRPKEEAEDCVQTRARHEVLQLERGLVVLEIVTGIAPLLGLVGTLHGMITLFGDIGSAGLGEANVVARGISITLNTTLMGLLIAIPSLIAWSYFSRRIESFAVEMETLLDEFLRRQYRLAVAAPPPPAPAPARSRPAAGRSTGRRGNPAAPSPQPVASAPSPEA